LRGDVREYILHIIMIGYDRRIYEIVPTFL